MDIIHKHIFCCFILSLLSGCIFSEDISVEIVNNSGLEVSQIELDTGSTVMRIGRIKRENSNIVKLNTNSDGNMSVKYKINGNFYDYNLGFITSGMKKTCVVTINRTSSDIRCCYGRSCQPT